MNFKHLACEHQPCALQVWNEGTCFSKCRRCRHDLIRGGGEEWKPVPKGHRVVWRKPPQPAARFLPPRIPSFYGPAPIEPVVLFSPSRRGAPASFEWEKAEQRSLAQLTIALMGLEARLRTDQRQRRSRAA